MSYNCYLTSFPHQDSYKNPDVLNNTLYGIAKIPHDGFNRWNK